MEAIKQKTGEIFALIGRLTRDYEKEKAIKNQRRRKETKVVAGAKMPPTEEEDRGAEVKVEVKEEEGFRMGEVKIEEEVELKFCKQEEHYPSYERTEFTLNHDPDPSQCPLAIFNQPASPKATYDLPATPPALHRTFSLEADADDLHFQ